MSEPLIDEDIRKARTLPSAWYTELEHFKQLQSVFSGWQFAAHQSEFGANNVLPIEHYEAITGESVVLDQERSYRMLLQRLHPQRHASGIGGLRGKNPAVQVPWAHLQFGWNIEAHAGIRRGNRLSNSER